MGLGAGLYWGEGTKAKKGSVRLGNTDPQLILKFIEFLTEICGVEKNRLIFWLQILSDIFETEALDFWAKKLKINKNQFNKITVTKARSLGTYTRKSRYGVLSVYFHNTKLRNILVDMLPR